VINIVMDLKKFYNSVSDWYHQ